MDPEHSTNPQVGEKKPYGRGPEDKARASGNSASIIK